MVQSIVAPSTVEVLACEIYCITKHMEKIDGLFHNLVINIENFLQIISLREAAI